MPNTYTDRLKFANPTAGDCNWDDEWRRNERIRDAVAASGLDNNFVKSGLSLTDGGGLSVDLVAGVAQVSGVDFDITGGNLSLTGATVEDEQPNFIYIDDAGAIQITTTEPTETNALIGVVDCDTTSVVRIADTRRTEPGVSEVNIDAKLTTHARKNLVINGCFRVNQRNGHNVADSTNFNYPADRFLQAWYLSGALSTQTLYSGTVGGYVYYSTVATAFNPATDPDCYVNPLIHRMEGYDMIPLRSKPLTISFLINVPVDGNYCAAVYLNSISKTFVHVFSATAAAQYQKISFTVPAVGESIGITDENRGFTLNIAPLGGSNREAPSENEWVSGNYSTYAGIVNWAATVSNVLIIGQVQIEWGEEATDFEHRTIEEELSLCYRYYYKNARFGSIGYKDASGVQTQMMGYEMDLPTVMNHNPTLALTGGAYINCSFFDLNVYNAFNIILRVDTTATRYRYWDGVLTANAELS